MSVLNEQDKNWIRTSVNYPENKAGILCDKKTTNSIRFEIYKDGTVILQSVEDWVKEKNNYTHQPGMVLLKSEIKDLLKQYMEYMID